MKNNEIPLFFHVLWTWPHSLSHLQAHLLTESFKEVSSLLGTDTLLSPPHSVLRPPGAVTHLELSREEPPLEEEVSC